MHCEQEPGRSVACNECSHAVEESFQSFLVPEHDIRHETDQRENRRLKEAIAPIMLAELRMLKRMCETRGLLPESERNEIEELDRKIVTLARGGYMGSPRRDLDF